MTLTLILGAIFAYLLGSIPFGLVLSRLGGYGDIRKIGSGNIGATNVLRTGNKALAAATLGLDVAKGVAAVLILTQWGPMAASVGAVAVFLGHLFPVWLGFKGGKGVATAAGVMLAYLWPVGVAALVVWLLVAAVTRYSSLAAVTASVLAPFAAWFASREALPVIVVLILAVLVLIRHADNIRRLLRGEEGRINLSSRGA
jgi:acyl phosphate:glycerol-3-phosphate acyltransferase